MAFELDTSPLIKNKENRIQKNVGMLLYYTRAADSAMMVTLGSISDNQAKRN